MCFEKVIPSLTLGSDLDCTNTKCLDDNLFLTKANIPFVRLYEYEI